MKYINKNDPKITTLINLIEKRIKIFLNNNQFNNHIHYNLNYIFLFYYNHP